MQSALLTIWNLPKYFPESFYKQTIPGRASRVAYGFSQYNQRDIYIYK